MSNVCHCMHPLTREKEQSDGKTPARESAHNNQFLTLHLNQMMKAEGQGGSWGGIVTVCVCTCVPIEQVYLFTLESHCEVQTTNSLCSQII
jgi:hypothetical protein